MLWGGDVGAGPTVVPSTTTPSEVPCPAPPITPSRAGATAKQKVGLVICMLYGLANIPSVLFPAPGRRGRSAAGDPRRRQRSSAWSAWSPRSWPGAATGSALRVAAGAIIVITLTGLPAFFVDVPMAIKALVGFSVVLTVVAVVLMFSGDRRPAPVTD